MRENDKFEAELKLRLDDMDFLRLVSNEIQEEINFVPSTRIHSPSNL